MDSETRNDGDLALRGKETALDAIALAHEHATGEHERTIEPGVVDHAAICLGIKTQGLACTIKIRDGLDLKGGRIVVARSELEVIISRNIVLAPRGGKVLAHLERDHTRGVALRVIASARLDIPRRTLGQIRKARVVELGHNGRRRVEHARARLDKVDEVVCRLNIVAGNTSRLRILPRQCLKLFLHRVAHRSLPKSRIPNPRHPE